MNEREQESDDRGEARAAVWQTVADGLGVAVSLVTLDQVAAYYADRGFSELPPEQAGLAAQELDKYYSPHSIDFSR